MILSAKDRVEQRVARGFTAEEIAVQEHLSLKTVLAVMRAMDEAHNAPEVIPLADADKVIYLPPDEDRPEPRRGIRSNGCAVCFRRRANRPHGVCPHCNEAADRWEASLTPVELTELDASMQRHPAGKNL